MSGGCRSRMRWRLLAGSLCVGLATGCQTVPARDPAYAPMRPAPPPSTAAKSGAIYQVGWDMRLFEDTRPRRVGDILTIKLVEKTDASKQTETNASKETSVNVQNPTIFGTTPEFGLPGFLPLASTNDNTLETGVSSSQEFDGEGESSQSNSLQGEITVTVVELLPNGNLVVRGEKVVAINRGDEYIRLAGIVRPEDIAPDNTVESTRVADVQIEYSGRGEVADAGAVGWLARFFLSVLWPF